MSDNGEGFLRAKRRRGEGNGRPYPFHALSNPFPSPFPGLSYEVPGPDGCTLGGMLFVLQVPTVEIAKGSWANDLLKDAGNVRLPRGLAAWGGFGDLRKHRLPKGDAEVRVWGGFGLTNLGGTILRRKGGVWTAVRLIGGVPGTRFPSKKATYTAPKEGWPVFWRKMDALHLWTLPDESTLPQKDRHTVFDGFSYLVETQRDGRYRAYAYANPEFQKQWPEAAKMVSLAKLLETAFPPVEKGPSAGM